MAEFYNAFTNIVAVGGGLAMLFHTLRRPIPAPRNMLMARDGTQMRAVEVLTAFSLIVVGVGSFLFHGTQQFWAELVDEIGLLVMMCFHLMCLFELHPWLRGKNGRVICFICSPIFVGVTSVVYAVTGWHSFFTFCLTVQVLVVLFFIFTGYRRTSAKRHELFFVVLAVVSRLLWEPEFWLCQGDYLGYLREYAAPTQAFLHEHFPWAVPFSLGNAVFYAASHVSLHYSFPYEWDILLWGHPIFHIGSYAALVYLNWHSLQTRDDYCQEESADKIREEEKKLEAVMERVGGRLSMELLIESVRVVPSVVVRPSLVSSLEESVACEEETSTKCKIQTVQDAILVVAQQGGGGGVFTGKSRA